MSKEKKKVRQYSTKFLKIGFIILCLLCQRTLLFANKVYYLCQQTLLLMLTNKFTMLTNFNKRVNEIWSSKKTFQSLASQPCKLEFEIQYFETLKNKFENQTKITSLFPTQTATLNCVLEASYEIFFLIAKNRKNYTIGNSFQNELYLFCKKVLQIDEKDLQAMPLSNRSVSRKIDEIEQGVEQQFVKKLKSQKFL